MAWRDEMRDGSFRGAPFLINSAAHEFGRRTELREYPQRDTAGSEDLGRRARRFSIDCYVLGPDYMTGRDALIEACEQPGPGTLIHPYYGTRTVVIVGPGHVRESTVDGGMAVFSLDFAEDGEQAQPSSQPDTPGQAKDQADAATSAGTASFADRFSVRGLAAFVSTDALALVGQAVAAVEDAAGLLTISGDPLFSFRSLAGVLRAIGLPDLADALGLATNIAGLIRGAASLASTPDAALASMMPLFEFGADLAPVPTTTPTRIQQATNGEAVCQLVRRVAACEAVRAASDMTFASYEDAAAVRDQLGPAIDDLAVAAGDLGDDGAFEALQDLRLILVRDITIRGGSLAHLFSYTPPATTPALVLAHRLYDDATRDQEIIARNHIRNPLFVLGGAPLEVLTPNG